MYKFENIDITDSKRVNGYAHYLIALQKLDPIYLNLSIREMYPQLINEMKCVCNMIEDYLSKCEPYNLSRYTLIYTALYPFCKQQKLDSKVLKDIDFRILNAWLSGDKQISDIEAYRIIGHHLNEIQDDLQSWYQCKQSEYFSDLNENGKFVRLSPLDNYRMLNALWEDCIWDKYPNLTYSKGNIVFMNYEEELDKLDTETLSVYYRFHTCYAFNMFSRREKMQREVEILSELCKRTDLDEYDRKGFELEKQVVEQIIGKDFEIEIADIASRMSVACNDKTALSELSSEFQGILTDMFDKLPQFIDTDEDLDFKGGKLLVPVSNETFTRIVDIHFFLLNSDTKYDEFIFTNVLCELENRERTGDVIVHEIITHYDDLCYQTK